MGGGVRMVRVDSVVSGANPVKTETASRGSYYSDCREGETPGVQAVPSIVGRDGSGHEAALPCFTNTLRKLVPLCWKVWYSCL